MWLCLSSRFKPPSSLYGSNIIMESSNYNIARPLERLLQVNGVLPNFGGSKFWWCNDEEEFTFFVPGVAKPMRDRAVKVKAVALLQLQ